MVYTDTRDKNLRATFRQAVVSGMNPTTGGLYIPVEFPKIDCAKLAGADFCALAFEMCAPYVDGEIPAADLKEIIASSYPFEPRLVDIGDNTKILELFHGPTCAFKDFGARFMARAMSYFNRGEGDLLHILVATSGDTGSAVGSAFHNVEGLDVTILYPDGKISPLQEKQLSTFDNNVRALKVSGSFDDCQRLVKTAFTDNDLRAKFRLSSANSINISRLLPQSFYYMYAALNTSGDVVVTVPSGNFGNLTSGLIAREMGAPILGFVAATNSNRTIPDWLASGEYKARPSVETYANAMDVGAPSNYERMSAMYSLEQTRSMLAAYWLDNDGIIDTIRACKKSTGYTLDPHGAVAYKAWSEIRAFDFASIKAGATTSAIEAAMAKPGITPNKPSWANKAGGATGIVLETAHPAKFSEIVKEATGSEVEIPERLQRVMSLPDRAVAMENNYEQFKEWLYNNL